MAMLAVVATSLSILLFSAISSVASFNWDKANIGIRLPAIPSRLRRPAFRPPPTWATAVRTGSARSFTPIRARTENNGSAFAGISVNTPWYNLTLGLATLIGRFLFMIPLIAIGGSLAAKKKTPVTSGTFPTHGPLFVGLFVGTVVLIAALTFFPAISLGPAVEHFLMHSGKLFYWVQPVLNRLAISGMWS